MAGEVFVHIGQEIARRSPFPHTVALGYSNGLLGYVPTADAYALGGYEVNDAYRYFGTLMIANHRGLVSLGLVLTLGVMFCMTAALVFLPAALNLMGREQAKSEIEPLRRAA